MSFNFPELLIGGVALAWLLPRLVEFCKEAFGLQGKRNIWIVAGTLGFLFAAVAAARDEGLIPAIALPWIRVVVMGLGGLVAACGAVGEYLLSKQKTESE